MKRFSLLLVSLLLTCSAALAQVTVSGTVVQASDNEPVIGATVTVVGTKTVTATDFDGHFTVNVPNANSQLHITYIGMAPTTVQAKNGMIVELYSNTQDLDEVVVVAYGTAKKSELTGAVSQVTSQQIEARPVTSVTSALEGTTTGLVVNSTYGQPGSDASIRIRGFASINGSNEPLYVIDGVPFGGNISDLNSADIESITVLKDATSSALYGNRAGNGVIMINTKKGRNDKARINASIMMGTYNRGIPEYDRMDARQWMNAMMQSYVREIHTAGNSGENTDGTPKVMSWADAMGKANQEIIGSYLHYNIFDQPSDNLFNGYKLRDDANIKSEIAGDLDWFKAAIRSGFRQEYNLSGDGGSKTANYYLGVGYTKEDGYTKESGFERISGRARVNLEPKTWFKAGLNLSGSHQLTRFHSDSESSYKNAFSYCRNIAPIYPVYQHDLASPNGAYVLDEEGNRIYDSGEDNGRPQYSGRHYLWEIELDTDKTYRILESFKKENERRNEDVRQNHLSLIGKILYITILMICFTTYLSLYRKDYFDKPRSIAMLYALIVVFALLTALFVRNTFIHVYILPYAMVPIFIRVFMDSRTAFMTHITMVLVCAGMLQHPFEFTAIQSVAGLVAISSLRELSQRSQLFKTAIFITLACIGVNMAFDWMNNDALSQIGFSTYNYLIVNGVALLFAYPLLYLMEKAFGFTSDITLIESSNTNNELLRRMSEVAPGTFNHSIQVANLAGEIANKIGAKAQLVRTGALYHDIGKLSNPIYFTENQSGIDPHDTLNDIESAQIIISHVTEGMKMADKYNLPAVIRDFIATHHGQGKAKFFYIRYKNEHPDEPVDDLLFTYPGPNPFTREQACLMMADTIEAASRSLSDYTEQSIRGLVDRLIDGLVAEGYFRECPITFRDIQYAKTVLIEKLKTIYHTRVSYPSEK